MAFENTFTAPWQFLTKYVEGIKDEPFFLKTALGKNKIMSPSTSINWRLVTKGNGIASMGYRDDPASNVDLGVTSTEITVTPPQIFEKDYIESATPLTQNFDPRQLANLDTSSDIYNSLQYIYSAKLEGLKARINRRIEWMFAELLKAGKYTYTSTTRTVSQDYGADDAISYALNSSMHPLDTLETYAQNYADDVGVFPNLVIASNNVAAALMQHADVKTYIDANTYKFGSLQPAYKSPTVKYIGKFDEFAIPEIYVYNASYTNSAGTSTKYIGDDYLIMTNTMFWNMGYAGVIDYEIEPSGRPLMFDMLVKERIPEENEGHIKTISALSYPLPMLLNAKAVKVLDVTVS